MKKINPSKLIIPSVYVLGITLFALGLVSITKGIKDYTKEVELERLEMVFNEAEDNNEEIQVIEEVESVVSTNTNIIKPYKGKDIKLSKSYYDVDGDNSAQEDSIIFYGNTYMQNQGTEYSSKSKFDVYSVIDGTVSSITKDDTTLYTIEIKHDNDLVSIYEYLDEVNVKVDDIVSKGDRIGVTGKSIINNDNMYTLHFEVYHKGESLNPESLYTMKVEDFN